jgi:hypothetical protein
MGKRAAVISQADIARAVRAARQAGAGTVEVRPDGTIVLRLDSRPTVPEPSCEEVIL